MEDKRERDKYKCVLYRNNFGQNEFNVDITCQDNEADMSMLNTSIFVGKITEKETNTSACYTGITLVKMNSVDIFKTEAYQSEHVEHKYIRW